MSTASPPNTPTPGSRVLIETPRGDERRATVREIEPTPRFNALDAVKIHVRLERTDLIVTRDELVRW